MARGGWWIATAAALVAMGCGDDDDDSGGGSAPASEAEAEQTQPEPQVSLDDHRVHLDLRRIAHLADVDHRGLFVDFGTPARMKYTVGAWRTGWRGDGASDEATYTDVGRRGSIYFPLDARGPLTIRLRLKAVAATKLSPYVNGEGIELIKLDKGSGFRDYDVVVPEDKVKRGENRLLLVFAKDGGEIGKSAVAAKVESIRVDDGTGDEEGDYQPPRYAELQDDVELGDRSRPSLAVRRPASVRFHLEVPGDAKLSFGVGLEGSGKAPVELVVRPEGGGKPQKLFEAEVGSSWKDEVVDLSAFAGQVVRIDLVAGGSGKGRVAWAEPAIYVPKPQSDTERRQAKNVIVLLIDTLRASKLQIYNSDSRVRTPHLTEVADAGTVFESAQSPENWTKPSCASILTALYPATHRTKEDASQLPSSAQTIGEHFQAKGIETASFIANGYVSRKFGFDQGWGHYTNYIRESKSTEAENVFEEAGDWIEEHKDERFFAYIQTIDPHVPYDPPEDFLEMYDDRPYDGQVKPRMTAQLLAKAKKNPPEVTFSERDKQRLEALHDGEITYHDHWMGKFIERMKKLGVWEDTLFVITSDHGEEFDEHGSWGHGHSTYQELLHVPLVFHMPGTVPQGRRVPHTVSTLDIAPTALELAGIEPMKRAEGRSLVGYMREELPPGPSVAFSDFLDDHRVIRAGRWKLILKGLNVEFYDLESDPLEQKPLDRNEHPVAFRYARTLLGQFLGATDRARWLDADQGEGKELEAEETDIDEETRGQLRALGYAN